MQIEDGKGTGYKVGVTDENKLRTYTTTETEIAYESETNGRAYLWSAYVDCVADDNFIWLRNDSTTQNLIVQHIEICTDIAGVMELFFGTGNTSGGGTPIVGLNLNRQSSKVALATFESLQSNVDAGAGMSLAATYLVAASTPYVIDFHSSLILGYLDEAALNSITNFGVSSANVMGYYHTVK